ncbi:EscU/YscU/HrcU family type III secretion system export apparatus switch protein [Longirhabdus pacifica]|uniref:EscU/YscU/HrcU family type III secretion system export apparatus switch protein n=1 Tax=Longirhabdus pacifica TaxID=2305227 RepID=UPI001008AF17|nr:EscU/YscU/HrcU family type III secretion system export apparatus switch protein [Longirhabdus pacifica]
MSTKNVKKAAAITYDPAKGEAPILSAKGRGFVAQRIIDTASEHGVPIQEDASLIEVLSALDIDKQIPPELYQMVAEILTFVYQVDGQWDEHFLAHSNKTTK